MCVSKFIGFLNHPSPLVNYENKTIPKRSSTLLTGVHVVVHFPAWFFTARFPLEETVVRQVIKAASYLLKKKKKPLQ